MTEATQTLTLTDFLLARIAEDEAEARRALVGAVDVYFGDTAADALLGLAESEGAQTVAVAHFRRHDPARVLAECEAKRRIVDLVGIDGGVFDDDAEDGIRYDGYPITRALAAVYADHPDYRPEWKP